MFKFNQFEDIINVINKFSNLEFASTVKKRL